MAFPTDAPPENVLMVGARGGTVVVENPTVPPPDRGNPSSGGRLNPSPLGPKVSLGDFPRMLKGITPSSSLPGAGGISAPLDGEVFTPRMNTPQ